MALSFAILLCALFLNGCVARKPDYLGDLPIENPDLLGGDILGIDSFEDRSASVNPYHLWPNGVVPYVEDPGLKSVGVWRTTIMGAIMQYTRNTCIKFVPRTTETDYIRMFPGEGCYSHVGRTGGQQPVSLGQGCGWMGTVVHELGHAIGFYHEQNRSDRDEYLTIFWENIKEGLDDQFFKLKPEKNQLLTAFDYDSIMLYGSYTFSKDRENLRTMEGKGGLLLRDVAKKHVLSKNDIKRINMLYNCK